MSAWKECLYGDPVCGCQDGKQCDYEGSGALFVPPAYVRQIQQRHRDRVNEMQSDHFKSMGDERKRLNADRDALFFRIKAIRELCKADEGRAIDPKLILEILDA